jgi:hydroxypyruvate reductase/glycerate 2-kinase
VAAVRPQDCLRRAFADAALPLRAAAAKARRILVVGAGKAGAAMSAGVEDALAECLGRVAGLVNVPAECVKPLRAIKLHAARPAGTNQPTEAGVKGARQILDLLRHAGKDDIALCLLSGGGSALLPAPVKGITLQDKQLLTLLLHACGATINEMNKVRKHLSEVKGGRLAQAFAGRALYSLIISDVVGDPLDVIASGPTAPDPTSFADAWAVLEKYRLLPAGKGRIAAEGQVPPSIVEHLRKGARGKIAETLKKQLPKVHNYTLANNATALAAARAAATSLGYQVLNLGAYLEGETRQLALTIAGIVRSTRADQQPLAPPVCVLLGGETTVTLTAGHGLGGRNQEFVLAVLAKLGEEGMRHTVVLSGGTDGEDGPTDAAGAVADELSWPRARELDMDAADFLTRNDSYHFFEPLGGLIKTGLTETNVMDIRVILMK